jgi:hypothetical protein
LLLTWPLALMPYLTAYLVYTVLGLALYLAVVSDGERRADHLLLLTLAPATIVNIWCGQVASWSRRCSSAGFSSSIDALSLRACCSGCSPSSRSSGF